MKFFQKLNQSLKARFIIFLALILTFTIGVSSYIDFQIQYNQLVDFSKEKLRDLSDTIERSIKHAMKQGRSKDVKQILQTVGTLPDIERIRIFSRHGRILISSLPNEKGRMVDPHDLKLFHARKFATVYDFNNLQQPTFCVIKPIINEPPCFRCHGTNPNQINGVLELEVSMDKVHRRLSRVRRFMILSTLSTLLVLSISIIFLLSHLVNKPINNLITTMRKTQAGDLTARVKPESTLEFRELGRNFNSTISKLEKAQKGLKHLHEQQMERVSRLATIGELAAGIAHEIKNPIAGIGGAIQILMQDLSHKDPRREIFEEILKQIDRIDQDVKDLLSYARTAKPTLAEQNINILVQQSLLLIRDRAAQKNVKIITELDDTIPRIEVDEKQIQQVLVNLALNGIQAMPDGGRLTFSSRIQNHESGKTYMEIRVEDTGKGIPPENLSKIFTPFFTTRHTGTGLGLPISQKIIQQHHGKIQVRSKLGEGTCFTILLPVTRTGAMVS